MEERGSEKLTQLFSGEKVSREDLAKAIAGIDARTIKRWWWIGQPAIDRIRLTLQVDKPQAGKVLDGVLSIDSSELQVGARVFPIGIPKPEFVNIEVDVHRNVRQYG